MPRTLVTDRAAEEDLTGILTYSYENWGLERGDRYFDVLEKDIVALLKGPQEGHDRSELLPEYWSKRSQKHVIFYTFTVDEIRIRRVLHGQMDPGRHLSK